MVSDRTEAVKWQSDNCIVYLNEGYEWIVDIDLEKFFDNVPQDKLMSLVTTLSTMVTQNP